MKVKGKLLLTLFLLTWVFFAAVLFLQNGNRFIGKTYFDSEDFYYLLEEFKSDLNDYVLTNFNADEAKKKVTITDEEIEYYRNYYGLLTDQVEDIHNQYEERISEAEEQKNTKLKDILIKERDQKIEDITKNFEDDDYVKEKIKKIKYTMIDEYAKKLKDKKEEFLSTKKYFSFNLKNVKTGEVYNYGITDDSNIYEELYGDEEGYYHIHDNGTVINIHDIFDEETIQNYELFLFSELHLESDGSQYEGIISVPKSMLKDAKFKDQYENYKFDKIMITTIWVSGIVALILLFTIAKPSRQMFTQPTEIKKIFNKLPLDVKIFILFICLFIIHELIEAIGISFYSYRWLEPLISDIVLFFILFFFIITFIFFVVWIWESINKEEKIIKELKGSMLYQLGSGIVDLFLYRSIAGLVIITLITVMLFGIGFGLVLGYSYDASILVFIISFVGLPVVLIFLQQMGYLNRIMNHTKQMADGKATSEIKVKGKFPLANHAANLNKVREGVQKSMLEQAKSERLKTELITNVSHDLRTPLTSIITYTDLLKNENITEEERKHYIDVLDKKSARLKTLIEDLFEVSKMASGNIELHRERLDLNQLLQQAIGEHKESFENENLELRVTIPDEAIFAYVDGQKWWRVLDNLIVNALKYSLSGTRVYVTLSKQGNEVIFTIKNISSYELTENANELVERFKRADASRNTEGSGLGLAIVQSIVNLHNGRMNIEVDGDLFKVTVIIRTDLL